MSWAKKLSTPAGQKPPGSASSLGGSDFPGLGGKKIRKTTFSPGATDEDDFWAIEDDSLGKSPKQGAGKSAPATWGVGQAPISRCGECKEPVPDLYFDQSDGGNYCHGCWTQCYRKPPTHAPVGAAKEVATPTLAPKGARPVNAEAAFPCKCLHTIN